MELFKIKSSIDERANALTYHISTVSTAFSGHIVKNYRLSYQQHLRLILISTAQQIHLIDRLLCENNLENRKSIIHRVFIGQARMIAGLWPQFFEQGSLEFFSDKQLEYMQYPKITENNDLNYPRGTLLWEFGEEIALNSNNRQNHQVIMITMGTYKFYYTNNSEIMEFIIA
jgi:hypothetical protein